MKFKNRTREIKEIQDILETENFEFIIIYGRRRIGKTELILNTTQNKKRVYYLAVGEHNLDRFYNVCGNYDSNILTLKKSYENLFNYLKDKVDIVIIDEFQNVIQEDPNILNLFQSIIDLQLTDSNLKLFILGSSVSIISSKVLNYRSPLYGRRTGSIKLKPINFYDFKEFFPQTDIKERIEIYGFADGIPYYLNKIDKSFWDWLSRELSKESSLFRDEVDFLMRYEFSRPGTYKLILEAIAFGKTKLNEIKNFIKIKRTDISPYLKNLIDVDMVKREVPITENVNSRRGRYYLKDNFLKFWFRFIYPNLSSIEEGFFNINIIKNNYSHYLGKVFEDVVKNFIIRAKMFDFTKIGRWWWKGHEIDLIALNEGTKEIIFIECKWQENINAVEIVKNLEDKTIHVKWNLEDRKELYIVFAKTFFRKITKYNGIKVHCFDLSDLEKKTVLVK